MKIKSFEELEVWQRAHELTLLIYDFTRSFPREEQFGLVSQLRRSAASVGANIAEGFGRRTTNELLRSLQIANGEVEEARYFAMLSRDLRYINPTRFAQLNQLCGSISQLLSALRRSLNNSRSRVTSHQSQVTVNGRRQP